MAERFPLMISTAGTKRLCTSTAEILSRSGGMTGGTKSPAMGCFHFPADLSLSFTGRFASGFYYPLPGPEPYVTEWGEGPWNKQIDIRLEKGFPLGGNLRFSLYVDLINAFNWSNIVAFSGDRDVLATGTIAWIKNGDPTGGPLYNRPVTSREGTLLYGVPREVYFGAQLDF